MLKTSIVHVYDLQLAQNPKFFNAIMKFIFALCIKHKCIKFIYIHVSGSVKQIHLE